MVLRKFNSVALLFASLVICSCQSKDENIPQYIGLGCGYAFCNREVCALDLNAGKVEDGDVWYGDHMEKRPIFMHLDKGDTIASKSLYIRAFTRGKENPNDVSYYGRMEYRIPGNEVIEEQLRTWVASIAPELEEYFAPIDTDCNISGMEYRTEPCKDIKITSSAPLFGSVENEDVTDKFRLASAPFSTPVFSSDDFKMVETMPDLSIEDYLSINPLVNAVFLFRLNEAPKQTATTSFTIDIELEDGKHVVNTTQECTLTVD